MIPLGFVGGPHATVTASALSTLTLGRVMPWGRASAVVPFVMLLMIQACSLHISTFNKNIVSFYSVGIRCLFFKINKPYSKEVSLIGMGQSSELTFCKKSKHMVVIHMV